VSRSEVIRILRGQLARMDATVAKMSMHEHRLFVKCVDALERASGDPIWRMKASMYAGECAEVRRMLRVVLASRYALERAVSMLESEHSGRAVWESGEILATLRKRLSWIIPEVSYLLGVARDKLLQGEIPVQGDAGRVDGILAEADRYADERMKDKPDLPSVEGCDRG
jgi:division protein CdvB (Snf7/Vps24/ESCRT-III family)